MRDMNDIVEFNDIIYESSFYDDFALLEASVVGSDDDGDTYIDKVVNIIESQIEDPNKISDAKLTKMCNLVIFPDNVEGNTVKGEKIHNMVFESDLFDEDFDFEDIEEDVEIEVEDSDDVTVEVDDDDSYDPELDDDSVEEDSVIEPDSDSETYTPVEGDEDCPECEEDEDDVYDPELDDDSDDEEFVEYEIDSDEDIDDIYDSELDDEE